MRRSARSGDARDFWTEKLTAHGEEIALTWHEIGEPLLIHTQPGPPPARKYGVCTVLIPAPGRSADGQWGAGEGAAIRDRDGKGVRSAPVRWHSPKAGPRRGNKAGGGASSQRTRPADPLWPWSFGRGASVNCTIVPQDMATRHVRRGSQPGPLVLHLTPGGAEGNRTPDLLNAIQALSQLSYGPNR